MYLHLQTPVHVCFCGQPPVYACYLCALRMCARRTLASHLTQVCALTLFLICARLLGYLYLQPPVPRLCFLWLASGVRACYFCALRKCARRTLASHILKYALLPFRLSAQLLGDLYLQTFVHVSSTMFFVPSIRYTHVIFARLGSVRGAP